VKPILFTPNLVIIYVDGASKAIYPLRIRVECIRLSKEFILAKQALELMMNGTC